VKQVKTVATVNGQSEATNYLLWEDQEGVINVGNVDGLQRLQMQRMLFKK